MATEIESLVVRLEATTRGYERALARANAETRSRLGEMEGQFRRSQRNIEKIGADMGGGFVTALRGGLAGAAGVLAGVFTGAEIGKAAAEFTGVQNALKAAGFEGERLKTTYDQLFEIAQRQSAPIKETVGLFTGLSVAQKELNATQPELLRFTELTTQALRVSGTSAQAASGALLQLRQAMGGGVIQAQEFNSLIDGARPLLEAVAAGMVEAGGSVAKLTALVKDGQISSEAFFRAGLAGAPLLEDRLKTLADTPAQAFERLKNQLVNTVGQLDAATGASATLASGMTSLTGTIASVGTALAGAIVELRRFNAEAGKAVAAGLAAQQSATSAASAAAIEARLRSDAGLSPLQRRGLEQQLVAARGEAEARQRAANSAAQGRQQLADDAVPFIPLPGSQQAKPGITPIRAADYAPKPAKEAGGGGGGGGENPVDALDREIEALNRKTAALQQQASVLGLTAGEAAKSNAAFEAFDKLQREGVTLTDEQRQKIMQLAEAYGQATTKLEDMKGKQKAFNDLQQFIGQSLSGFFSDIISGGENAQKALSNLVKRLADAALQAALLGQGPLAILFGTAPASGSSVGGLFGALFSGAGSLFGGARANGGPVSAGKAYVVGEKRPELFVPGTSGRIIPEIPSSASGGGPINLSLSIDARGATHDAVAALRAQIPGLVMQTVNDATRRGARI